MDLFEMSFGDNFLCDLFEGNLRIWSFFKGYCYFVRKSESVKEIVVWRVVWLVDGLVGWFVICVDRIRLDR